MMASGALLRIAVDAMSGDFGPGVSIPAVAAAMQSYPDCCWVLVGREDVLRASLAEHRLQVSPRLEIVHAPQVIAMDESPAQALRGKKDSSMHVAVQLLRDGRADAIVSAGNTGALMAVGKVLLRTIPGIDRPAIAASLPSIGGRFLMLDLGANVDCRPEHLFQFAVMGSVLAEQLYGLERPRVALLNIGAEEIKGNEQVKEAGRLLRGSRLNFVGNVEGSDIWKGAADVVVSDGFVGNVALKASEGVASMVRHELADLYRRNWLTRLAYLINRPVLNGLRRRLDHRRYNGASLLGLNGIVVKSHGNADSFAFTRALEVAANEASHRLTVRIAEAIQEFLAPQRRGMV